MSAILAVAGGIEHLTDEQILTMLHRMQRGAECVEIWREEDVILAVARFSWELEPDFSGNALIARGDRYVVAADASVYYRDELRAKLAARGVMAEADTPSHLLHASLRAWHDAGVEHVDGDFAMVAWDRRERRLLCARDPSGKRPLHYAQLGRDVVVASTIGGVLAHPRCPDSLNIPVLAANIPGLHFSAGPETVYRAVQVVPHAHRMAWCDGRVTGPVRYWEPPVDRVVSRVPFEDAAEELRDTLARAVLERISRGSVNTVWMSGGWDSTAVFGAAQYAISRVSDGTRVRPVSISYPEGDPGREDEWIEAIARRWDEPVHWLDIRDISFLHREPERAAVRDEPYAHLYSHWNSALARGTRACDSRIALDGNGGDQLFASTDIFLADLFRAGRWLTLAREWPSRPRGGHREFFSSVIQPNLPPALLRFASWLRGGRPLRHYLARPIPHWVRPEFASRHALVERDRSFLGRPGPRTHAGREIDWMFTNLFVARAFSLLGSFALVNGVELRSPLSDRRVIDLALSRPWWERSSGRETKRLLRRSMQGLLPDEVLEPRPRRTGITAGYSHRSMRDEFPALLEQTLRRPLILEELGIVKTDALRRACADYPKWPDSSIRVALFQTLQTELWLRARSNGAGNESATVGRTARVLAESAK